MTNFTQLDLDVQLKGVIDDMDCKCIIECIQKGANINQTDNGNHTALHIFCYCKNIEGVKLCISKNADVNVQTKTYQLTPLILAVRSNNYEICKILLEAGADPTIKDHTGENVLDYAKSYKYKKIIKLIKFYLDKKKILLI